MNNNNHLMGMGMGRGAGGAMMPGQGIPQMGMPVMPNAMNANLQAQQMMQQDQQNSNMKFLQAILRKLSQEIPKPGWWRGANLNDRVQNTQRVFVMLHQILGQDVQSALHVAQAFESSSFNGSPHRQHYDQAIKNKIQEIQGEGQRRAMASSMGQPMPNNLNLMMGNPQMAPNNNSVFNPNMPNPNMQPTMMPNNHMMQQPQPGQHPNGMNPNNMVQSAMQAAQNRPNGMSMSFQGTPQEQQFINQKAESMYNSMSPAEKEAAKSKVPQHELMALQSRGEDPVRYLCRRIALAQYIKAKQNAGQQSAVPGAQFGGPAGMGFMVNSPMHSLLNNVNGGQMGVRQQPLPQGFNGNNYQFMQAHAMQKQQEGQTVVPASVPGINQPGANVQQHNLNAMQIQQQQQRALNAQRQQQGRPVQPGMPGQNPSNQGLGRGQPTTLTSPAIGKPTGGLSQISRPANATPQQIQQRIPQQATAARPLPQQPPNPSLPQGQSQVPAPHQQQQQTPTLNNNMPNMGVIPERIRDQLARLSPAEQAKLLTQYQTLRQQSAMSRNQQPESVPGPNQSGVQKPSQPPTAAPTATLTTAGQPPIHENVIRPTMRRMTPEERNLADQRHFPPQLLQIPELKQHVIPDHVKLWGQLKKWLSTLPISRDTMMVITNFQEKQFLHYLLQHQQIQEEQAKRMQEQKQVPQPEPEPVPERQPPTQSQTHFQQPRPDPQPQKPQQATAPAIKPIDKSAASTAPMGPSKLANPQENMIRFLLSLPDELTPEMCAQLKNRVPPYRQKSDEELRSIVAMQKMKAKQRLMELRQQPRNMHNLQNGQTQSLSNDQTSQQPPMNPPSVAVSKQSTSNLPLNSTSALVKQEQTTTESSDPQRSVPEPASGPSRLQPQQSQPQRGSFSPANDRVQQIAKEAQSAYRTGPIQNMNAEEREKMRQLLTQIKPFMPTKLLNAVFFYFTNIDPSNDRIIKQFFSSHAAMVDQFQDRECTILKETFTMTLESAERSLNALKMLYAKIKAYEHSKAASANASLGQKLQPGMEPSPPEKSVDIKAVPRGIKIEQPPAAPTSGTPPNSFHQGLSPPNRAPNGVPTYAPINFDPDQLVLPENRKRKLNANNQQPIKTQSPPPIPKSIPPPTVKPEPLFKCTQLGCEYQRKPFPTGELLARHIEDAHKEKEPEDGLQFALEMARHALSLDVHGKSIKAPVMEKTASAQTMKKSISSQSQTLKVEGGIAMSRGTTQTSNLGLPRTPQSMSKLWDKAGKTDTTKDPLTPDSWAECPVTPVEFARLFPLLEAVQGTMDMASLTPASTLASGKSERNTPNSDVVDNIAVVSEDIGNRIPLSFSNDILGFGQGSSLMDDDVLGMDWDEAFPDPKRRKVDVNGGFDASLFSLHLTNEDDFF